MSSFILFKISIIFDLIRLSVCIQEMATNWHGMIGSDSQILHDSLSEKKAISAEECYGSDTLDLDVLSPEWDLLVEIKYTWTRLLLELLSLRYVEGH
jgi:hypothetical protein